MATLYCYAYAEDEPSCEVIRSLVAFQNEATETDTLLRLMPGFPHNQKGCQNIRNRIGAIWAMAADAQLCTLVLTDLDQEKCAPALRLNWLPKLKERGETPDRLWFRIAVREIESWLMADRNAFAKCLGISVANLPERPDDLDDPKQYLLNLIRSKCNQKQFREMLPKRNAHVGPEYNPTLVSFIRNRWNPLRSAANSPSLDRALRSIVHLK